MKLDQTVEGNLKNINRELTEKTNTPSQVMLEEKALNAKKRTRLCSTTGGKIVADFAVWIPTQIDNSFLEVKAHVVKI